MVIVGIDEVGRGALAGELVVAGYAFRSGGESVRELCKDSKSFSSRLRREAVVDEIRKAGVVVVARRTAQDIDVVNIRQAVLSAMAEVAVGMERILGAPAHFCFDGSEYPSVSVLGTCEAIVKGDQKVPEIGAASILAKVLRDKEMEELARSWPGYGWEKNAGYGTKEHREGLARFGMTPYHRSWAKKFCGLKLQGESG